MPNNKKERHQAIWTSAVAIVEAFGIELLDSYPTAVAAAYKRDMANRLQEQTGCHRETARIHIAKACRRLRHPDYQESKASWGGMREGGFGRKALEAY